MHDDTIVLHLVTALFLALVFGLLLEKWRQPSLLGSIATGLCLPLVFPENLPSLEVFALGGEIGLIFLLFFIGSEANLNELAKNAKVSLVGTILQIGVSIGVCYLIGIFFEWEFSKVLFFGFCISLSSTAVVLKVLNEFGGTRSLIGQQALGILLVQDLAIVPMLIILNSMGETGESNWILPLLGLIVVGLPTIYIIRKGGLSLPNWLVSASNAEFQVFSSLIFCLGASLVTGFLGLSPALGAFLAGLVMAKSKHAKFFRRFLEPFRLLFVSIFFLSIGLMFDMQFVLENFGMVMLLTLGIMFVNTLVTVSILRLLKVDSITAAISGCLLAQVGEFSFLLSDRAMQIKVIDKNSYQLVISCIVISLVLTPFWLTVSRKVMRRSFGASGTMEFSISPKSGS